MQKSYVLYKATETFSVWNTLSTLLFSLYYFSFEKAAGKSTNFCRQLLLVSQQKWPRWYCSTTWSLRSALQSGHSDNHTKPLILLVWFPYLGTWCCYCVLVTWFNQSPWSKYWKKSLKIVPTDLVKIGGWVWETDLLSAELGKWNSSLHLFGHQKSFISENACEQPYCEKHFKQRTSLWSCQRQINHKRLNHIKQKSLAPVLMEPFIFSVISLAWQGTGWGADALAEAGRTDPASTDIRSPRQF